MQAEHPSKSRLLKPAKQWLLRKFQALRSTREQTELGSEQSRYLKAEPISSLNARRKATCSGTITSVVVGAYQQNPKVEIELADESGQLTVIWLGRKQIASIVAGAKVSVSGFVSFQGAQKIMYNPRYTIHATQEDLND